MILFGMKITSFINLFLFFVIAYTVSLIAKKLSCRMVDEKDMFQSKDGESRYAERSSLNTNTGSLSLHDETDGTQISFTSRLKLTFIKFLKLYFTPVMVACLKLTHCVNINHESRLYVYADLKCYTYWQIVIFTALIPCLLLFPICFEVALRLLKARRISTSQFLLACVCPIIALLLYIWHTKVKAKYGAGGEKCFSEEEESLICIILMNEEELFKESNCIGWQVMQVCTPLVTTHAYQNLPNLQANKSAKFIIPSKIW